MSKRVRGRADQVFGDVEEGYEAVADTFRRQFAEGRETGAACAVLRDGRMVVDLWGGYRDGPRRLPWERDTLVPVWSTTKGLASMTLAVAHSRGSLDFDEPVATYWPEFAQNGRAEITVRQLLSHQAGLAALDEPISTETLADPDRLAAQLARQAPLWEPGHRQGYHAWTLGFYEGELATGGSVLGLAPATLAELERTAAVPPGGRSDLVLRSELPFSLGFGKPFPGFPMGSSDRSYAMAGTGGSIGMADPDLGIGYAYTPNLMGFGSPTDSREIALRTALYRSVGGRPQQPRTDTR